MSLSEKPETAPGVLLSVNVVPHAAAGGVIRPQDAPYDVATAMVTVQHCEACGYHWQQWADGPHRCPACHPGQPKTFAERVRDPSDFLGPEWVWLDYMGSRGRWAPLRDFVLFERESVDAAWKRLTDNLPEDAIECGRELLPQLVDLAIKGYVPRRAPAIQETRLERPATRDDAEPYRRLLRGAGT